MAGARPLSAFWARPGKNSIESATELLDQWRCAVERQATYLSRQFPGEVD